MGSTIMSLAVRSDAATSRNALRLEQQLPDTHVMPANCRTIDTFAVCFVSGGVPD